MRLACWCGIVLCGVMVQGIRAQRNVGAQEQSIGANQSVAAAVFSPVTGAPYQAEKVLRSVQTLSDGTVITRESTGMMARDAEGRVREDLYMVRWGHVDGREVDKTLQSATVGDPVAHTILIWHGEKEKIAMQMQMPVLAGMGGHKAGVESVLTAPPQAPPPPPPGSERKTVAMGISTTSETDTLKDATRTEELGQQSIAGVLLTGKRVTTTIPTGKVGNDRPIVVVHEEWRSPELKILVKTMDTDPRSGEQTMELQGLVRTDPDAALFQAPAGYQVKDMGEMMKALGELGRTKRTQ